MFEKAVKNMQLHKVQEAEIQKAEERMKVKFPDDLLHFYREYGYGFVNNELHAVNRLMGPGSCADLRLREDYYECDPDLEMYEEGEEDALIFFENGDGIYMSIGFDDGKIYYDDEVIADTLEEFLEKIVDPDYWTDLVDDDDER